jgi:hypothetical protein
MPLKSLSPHQPPEWNDPYRTLKFQTSSQGSRLAVEIVTLALNQAGLTAERLGQSVNAEVVRSFAASAGKRHQAIKVALRSHLAARSC